MLACVFPGQGSQQRRMGEALFDSVREFTSVEAQIDSVLGYSLTRLCLMDPDNRLKETQYTQPALFVVNALHYYDAVRRGLRAEFLARHSPGEYDALLAAGVQRDAPLRNGMRRQHPTQDSGPATRPVANELALS